MFCPMIAHTSQPNELILKFLRISEVDTSFEIFPFIYSLKLYNMPYAQGFQVVTPEGDAFEFCFELGLINPINNFPFSLTYLSTDLIPRRFTIDLPIHNPDDCVVVSMFICGMLPQPDVTRYHNLFRKVQVLEDTTTNERRIEHSLSHGSQKFVVSTMTRRINTFYNRKDPSDPLRKLVRIRIRIGTPQPTQDCVIKERLPSGHIVYRDQDDTLFINASPDPVELTTILSRFGCNRENAVFPVSVYGHQLNLVYENSEFILKDYQVNREYKSLRHSNNYDPVTNSIREEASIQLICAYSRLKPADFVAKIPDFLMLYRYESSPFQFQGDPFPLLSNYINQFARNMLAREYPDMSHVQRNLRDSFVLDLSITDISLNRVLEELHRLDQESISLVTRSIVPSISFDYYNRLRSSGERVVHNLSSVEGLVRIRNFISRWCDQFEHTIIQQYRRIVANPIYMQIDIKDFLLSRPIFAAFAHEYTSVADDGTTRLSQVLSDTHFDELNEMIVNYLVTNTKQIMPIGDIIPLVLNQPSIIRLLYLHKNDSIASLKQFANLLRPFIKGNNLTKGLMDGLTHYANRFESRLQQAAKNRLRSRIATRRVLLPQGRFLNFRDMFDFFALHQPVRKDKTELKDAPVKSLSFNPFATLLQISKEQPTLLEKVLYYMLIDKLDYTAQELRPDHARGSDARDRIRDFVSSRQRRVLPMQEEYEQEVRRMESRFRKASSDSAYQIADEHKDYLEIELREYIELMIEHEMVSLEDDEVWTRAEIRELDREVAASLDINEDYEKALSVATTLISLLREQNPDVNQRYLGRHSINRDRTKLLK
jgi:hypothetical protein